MLMLKELERPKPAMLYYLASRGFSAALGPVFPCPVLHRLYSIFAALLSRHLYREDVQTTTRGEAVNLVRVWLGDSRSG